MSWKVTAEPSRFSEAVDWFLARSVITKTEALRLDADARTRAFWIGGGLQLAQVQSVFDEISKALESGEDFKTWRKRVRNTLRNDEHALTVFRNATQRAYSTGRWRQMHEPDVLAARPYFMHDSVLDSRTTETCKKLDGIVLPAEHEHWKTHWPPGHHRCRRGVRSLRKADAEKRGITNVPPLLNDAPGFGLAPDAQGVWKPDPKKHDPALIRELDRKSKKERKPKAPKETPKVHDPKYWEGQFEGQYGAAAPAVGWGRAMYERGLDRSAKEITDELLRLKNAGLPGLEVVNLQDIRSLPANQVLRGTTFSRTKEGRAFIALAEHSLTIKRGTFPLLRREEALKKAKLFFDELLDQSVARPTGYTVKFRARARAYHSGSARQIVLSDRNGTPTAIHELGHAIEHVDTRAIARSRAFLKARAGNDKTRSLREMTGLSGYRSGERTWEDKFFDPYVGKDYGERATEITSMGYEKMSKAGGFGLASLAEKDPEMLDFLLGQLAGR
jgi:SPP1 gp7 family putative phage head morphogenesis protein